MRAVNCLLHHRLRSTSKRVSVMAHATQQRPLLSDGQVEQDEAIGDKALPDGKAVLVLGASGLLGREVVQSLVEHGRYIVAAGRSTQSIENALKHVQPEESKRSLIAVRGGIDATDRASLQDPSIWQGVQQAVIALGPVLQSKPDGSRDYENGLSPEAVDYRGVTNAAEAASMYLCGWKDGKTVMETVVAFSGSSDATSSWKEMSDPIMGGRSSASWSNEADGSVWGGEVVWEGGGFCGTRLDGLNRDLSMYDGLYIVTSGSSNGERFKLNVKSDVR